MKRHKKSVKTADTNGEAQVYVLPPDVLEKLGIQLSNIASSTATSEDITVNQDLINDLEEGTSKNVENSSILETANLMKQSVFMSPTFVSTPETANEHTIANITIQTAEAIEDVKADNQLKTSLDNFQMIENSNDKKLDIIKDGPDNIESEDFMKYEPIREYEVDNESGDLVLTNSNHHSFHNNTVMNSLTLDQTSPVDEHVDEAYLSDGSNSNPGAVTELANNNLQLSTEQQIPNNRIKILSEQIIQKSDLNIIKKTQINQSGSCFLIPVSTIVTGKATKDGDNKHLNQNTDEDTLYSTACKNAERCSIIKCVSIVNNRLTIKDAEPSLELLDTSSEIANDDTNSKEMLNNKNDGTQNKSNRDIGAEKRVYALCNNTQEVSNTENTLIKSKLLIQGVEKPGGYQFDNVLKTYGRTNKQKRLPEIYHINNTQFEDHYVLGDVQTDLDKINISGGNKFCICNDYGLLADNDRDYIYEHVHFHNQRNAICNLETLLSMYEDVLLFDRTEMEYTEMVDDVVEAAQYNICWSSLMSEDKEENGDSAVLESNITSETNSDQLRRSNRKRKSTTKTIKCGACSLLIAEAEWDKHQESAHSLIAWKDDQPIIKSVTSNQDETTGNDKQTEKSEPSRKSQRKLISRTTPPKPDSKSSSDKKQIPKSPKAAATDPQNLMKTCNIELKDSIKSKVTPIVENQIKIKSYSKTSLDSMYTSKDMSISKDSPKRKECNLETIVKTPKNNIILPGEETKIKTDILKSPKEKDTKMTLKKFKAKENTTKLEVSNQNSECVSNADLKITRRSIIDVKDSLNANVEEITTSKGTPKSTVKRSTNSNKKSIPEHKNSTTKVKNTPKSSRKSKDGSKRTPKVQKDIPNERATQKLEVKATLESSKNSSKAIELATEATSKSTSLSKVVMTSKTYSRKDRLMNVVEHSKPTSANIRDEVKLVNEVQSNCHKKDLTDLASLQAKIESSHDFKKTSTEVTVTPVKVTTTGSLKEIDLFSSNTSSKKNIARKSNVKSPKNSDEKPSRHKNINSPEEIISHNLKRKSVDVNASARTPKSAKDENKHKEATTDCATQLRSKSGKPSTTLNLRKNIDSDSKEGPPPAKKPKNTKEQTSNDKSREISSLKISSTETKAKTLEIAASNEKNDNLLLNTEIVRANTTTTGSNTTAPGNSQSTGGGASSSNSDQNDTSSTNISSNQTSEGSDKDPPPTDEVNVIKIKQEVKSKCGVCKQEVDELHWLEHIAKEHNYLAWRENEPPLELEDEEAVRLHLSTIAKRYGELRCFKCNTVRKYAKAYQTHVRNCGLNESRLDASAASVDLDTTHDADDVPLSRCKDEGSQRRLQRSQKASDVGVVTSPKIKGNEADSLKPRRRSQKVPTPPPQNVTCAVCNETVLDNQWIDHIRLVHKYLAWKVGDPPLDVTDDIEVKIFLQSISKQNGGLICSKCGTVRFYVKKWFQHEASCTGDVANESSSSEDIPIAKSAKLKDNVIKSLPDVVKCGKCGKEMLSQAWIDHIETEHSYLAWIEGQPPLDMNDSAAVNAHLHALMKKQGALCCTKCGISRKYPKAFLTHISACEISGYKREDFFVEASSDIGPNEYECAVCLEKGPKSEWKKHAMGKHYNIAWMAGQNPINLKNPYAVEKYLKEYRTKHNLVCKVCGASRTSCYGFYAHILTCGKSESELENLMSLCDICNNKYLCIYRNQHIQMHREKQRKDEQKENNAMKAEEEKKRIREENAAPTGKRRAAQRAKKVMEKYTSNKPDGNHVCLSCNIGFDNQNLLDEHVCQGPQRGDASDSDESVKMEGADEESDDDMDVDSCVSEEEQDSIRRDRKHGDSQMKMVLPYKLDNVSRYCEKSFENFCELHYSTAGLFQDWRSERLVMLPEEKVSSYLPSLTNSCKIHLGDEWYTIMRFQGLKTRDITTLFTGAAIRCMQWVPHNDAFEEQNNYLSVTCYQHADCPRYGKDELHQHPGLIQIWNMGNFMSKPKFEFGIAHDFGTIWSMDWCPSGARDLSPMDSDFKDGQFRLGLLGVACSNGSAYILSIPLIDTRVGAGLKIFRPKPVAELRISSKSTDLLSRTTYQATSICWSPQKGHNVVMVGYSDGTTALYNLKTESPFLKSNENGVDIFYPFHDALTENSVVTGVSLSASQDLHRIVGGVASSSVTGATMSAWPVAPPVARSHLSSSGLVATPNWPAALLCSDELITAKATNVLEWWGGGRRFGSACAGAGCGRCGQLAVAAPPFIRLMRLHPAYTDLKKQIIATLKMVPLAQKRKLKTDDLGMVVEPLTYDDTIKIYGLEFRALPKKNEKPSKLCTTAEQCPERFPLSEMPAVAFCPSSVHHNRLAVASHAGFIFIIVA